MNSVHFLLYDAWDYYGDPRSYQLPFMKGPPYRAIAFVLLYVLFVKIIGPSFMKNREPFQLRTFMFIYNAFLIGFNVTAFLLSLWVTDFMTASWDCSPIDPKTSSFKANIIVYFGWLYFISKFLDWMDTIFFVFRKKANQASFLHVFHHAIMPLVAWFGLKFHPGPYSSFLPVVNVLVHAIMYTYYALSCSGPDLKQYTWFKKHITQLQILQFVLTWFHAFNAIVRSDCCWPRWLATLEAMNATLFLYMFTQFYRHAYMKKTTPIVQSNQSCDNRLKSD